MSSAYISDRTADISKIDIAASGGASLPRVKKEDVELDVEGVEFRSD